MNNNKEENKFKSFFKFITSTVGVLSLLGILLIIGGQVSVGYQYFPKILSKDSSIYPIMRTIGGAFLGSGVFTAIIKSKEYTDIFSNVIESIMGKKEFIQKRTDKREFWDMVSKLLYEEKFPLISEQIQEVIANHYLPTTAEYYIDNYEVLYNIVNLDDEYWEQHETIKATIRPTNPKSKIIYQYVTSIDLPELGQLGQTKYNIEEVIINDQVQVVEFLPEVITNTHLCHTLALNLHNQEEYKIIVKRVKILCKKTNLDKRFFASSIINNMKITLILPTGMNVDFNKMGTINEFVKEDDQTNNSTRMISWSYTGLILRAQGYIMIFK